MLTIIYKQKEHSNREPLLTKTIMKKVNIQFIFPPHPTCRILEEVDLEKPDVTEKKVRMGKDGQALENQTIQKLKMAEDQKGKNGTVGTITGE